MTNDEFEKRYQTSVLMAGRELALLRKVNADLLEALETLVSILPSTCDSIQDSTKCPKCIAMDAINHAANDMRFGITKGEKET